MAYQPPQYASQPGFNPQSQQPGMMSAQSAYAQPVYGQPIGQNNQLEASLLDNKAQQSRFAPPQGARDLVWAILFIAHFIFVLVLAIKYGTQFKGDFNDGSLLNSKFWVLISAFIGIGIGVSALWLVMIRNFANCLVWFTCLLSAGLCLGVAIWAFASNVTPVGVIMVFAFILNAAIIYYNRDRIDFAAEMLTTCVEFIADYPATIYTSFGFILVQAGWVLTWAVAAGFTLYNLIEKSNADDTTINVVYFAFLVSLYWGGQVIKNVVHMTVAGAFGTWYFYPAGAAPANATLNSLKRATTTSFGSICFGSLIVAVISAIRASLRAAKGRNSFAAACADCLISCIENIVRYFNHYAYTYCALYSFTYCEAGRATFELFASKGIDAVINDDFTGNVLGLGIFIGGMVTGAFGLLLARNAYHLDYYIVWILVAFLFGVVLATCAMEVLHSAIAAFFVCFAEDPAALAATRPATYQRIATAWKKRYGDLLIGGARV